ncbi:MAG TPA: PCRF domain-containing protein, partial [Candidatus Limnocylindrales bacterium]
MAGLDARTGEAGFWEDQRSAQKVLREAEALREESGLWRKLESRANSTSELLDLAQEEEDQELLAEVSREAAELERDYAQARRALLFGGQYDQRNALLTISAGAGGT